LLLSSIIDNLFLRSYLALDWFGLLPKNWST